MKTDTIETIRPVGDKLLVRPDRPDAISKGGIFIPDNAKEKPLMGTVISAGPGRTSETGVLLPNPVKEGDRILYNRFAGNEIKFGIARDEDPVILMSQDDVMAILERGDPCSCGRCPVHGKP